MKSKTASVAWNPKTYLEFAGYRARPVEDLLPRLELETPGAVYDLGCGPGNLTKKLKEKWPNRDVIGLDSSEDMLNAAKKNYGEDLIEWRISDISQWSAEKPAALVFANASLQWVPDHEHLFPRLFQNVRPGGTLAIQMPMTADAPYQMCIREVVSSGKWAKRLTGIHPHDDAGSADFYYELLCPAASAIDMWQTNYHHILTGKDPAVAWMSGTGLVPMLTQLDEAERADFLADYAAATRKHYPRQSDGRTIFTMKRLFIVARRAAA